MPARPDSRSSRCSRSSTTSSGSTFFGPESVLGPRRRDADLATGPVWEIEQVVGLSDRVEVELRRVGLRAEAGGLQLVLHIEHRLAVQGRPWFEGRALPELLALLVDGEVEVGLQRVGLVKIVLRP